MPSGRADVPERWILLSVVLGRSGRGVDGAVWACGVEGAGPVVGIGVLWAGFAIGMLIDAERLAERPHAMG
jgi:hypothetical protein